MSSPALSLDEVRAHAADATLATALALGDDVAAAARLNTLLPPTLAVVPIWKLAAWAAGTGLRGRLQVTADNLADPLRSLALAALDLLRGGVAQGLDLEAHASLLDALHAGGLVTAEQLGQLTALARQPRQVTSNDVARVVRDGTGRGLL